MSHSSTNVKLTTVCDDCITRLGVDKRLTMPLQFVQVSELPEFNPKLIAGLSFPGTSGAYGIHQTKQTTTPGGTTKITYKIAKTVKESVHEDDKSRSRSVA